MGVTRRTQIFMDASGVRPTQRRQHATQSGAGRKDRTGPDDRVHALV
jgi:hypothetical protein